MTQAPDIFERLQAAAAGCAAGVAACLERLPAAQAAEAQLADDQAQVDRDLHSLGVLQRRGAIPQRGRLQVELFEDGRTLRAVWTAYSGAYRYRLLVDGVALLLTDLTQGIVQVERIPTVVEVEALDAIGSAVSRLREVNPHALPGPEMNVVAPAAPGVHPARMAEVR